MQTYGDKIKSIRTSLKLSQRALGELTGSNRDKINSYEHGRARVPAEEWDKIVALLPQRNIIQNSTEMEQS